MARGSGWRLAGRRAAPSLLVVVGVLTWAGCTRTLPAEPLPGAGVITCAGVGMDAFLHGNAGDARVAWVESPGGRLNVLFPAGYSARFAPGLQVLDPAGSVVMEEGDYVYGACVGPDDSLIVDPSSSIRLACGPVADRPCREHAAQAASNLPGRSNGDVRAIRFTDEGGSFVATLRDGSTATGRVDLSE